MAISATAITDIVIPEIYLPYEYFNIITKSKFFNSGIIKVDPLITNQLNGGGTIFNVPARMIDETAAEPIHTETSLTVYSGTTTQTLTRRLVFGHAWGEEEIASALAGSRPEYELPELTAQYWGNHYETALINCARGIFADNIADDSSDLVNDIGHASDGALATDSNKVNADAIIDTSMKMTDRVDAFEGGGIVMRSEVYTRLRKLNLIDFVPVAGQPYGIPTYQTMTVIVDNSLPATAVGSGYDYWTILFEKGSVGFGEGGYRPASFITPLETTRVGATGVDNMYMRKCYAMNFKGFTWVETTIASTNPSLANLYDADNWNRLRNDSRTCGMALLISNG